MKFSQLASLRARPVLEEFRGGLRPGLLNPVFLLSVLLVLLLGGMIAAFWTAQSAERQQARYAELVLEQGRLSQELAEAAQLAATGDIEAHASLQQLADDFQANVDRLRRGDETEGIPPLSAAHAAHLDAVASAWRVERVNIQSVLASRQSAGELIDSLTAIGEITETLRQDSVELAEALLARDAPAAQVYLASRQLADLERVDAAVGRLHMGSEAMPAARDLAAGIQGIRQTLDALRTGSEDPVVVAAIVDPELRGRLDEMEQAFAGIEVDLERMVSLAPELQLVRDAASDLSDNLLPPVQRLDRSIGAGAGGEAMLLVAAGFGAAILLTLVGLAWLLVRAGRARYAASLEQNQRNQRAILRLLDELSTLADGDLTAHATVTEDITGAIADSVNSAIDALRSLVATINATAEDVAGASDRTQSTAQRLAAASDEQAREITSANRAITEMADSMERVSENARESAEVAMRSVSIAAQGAETVRGSIAGMDTIREQIQETSKRIKRLGESSQEIGDIIGVINDIAEQTNILALNAAIQASSAGETGRGFAVVADEVQRLAERASDATKRVEALITAIQTDTSEAVASMEKSTAGVVRGARLAEDAGGALGEIESVSKQIADLIQRISTEADQQAQTATGISDRMNVIQNITDQTAEGTRETATSIGELTKLSRALRETVAGFKLPEGDETDDYAVDARRDEQDTT